MNAHQKPNILIISVDSMRADHLSVYGYEKETSPNLDSLALDGILYENAFAPANWTGASVASILTGLYPTSHGYTNARYFLDSDVTTVASVLQQNGYFTICFSNNMYISPQTGLDQGFMDFRYQGKPEKLPGTSPLRKKKSLSRGIKTLLSTRVKSLMKDVIDYKRTEKSLSRDDGAFKTEQSLFQWLNQHPSDKPFFAYIHYQEPHSIYFPPFPFRRRFFSGSWLSESTFREFDHIGYYAGKLTLNEEQIGHYKELYDGEIAYLDWRLGRLFDFLRHKKIYDQTLIAVTADHGENMGEKGHFWHAFCLYDPLIRIPLIVRYPEWFTPSSRVQDLVQSNDIVPTCYEGLGIDWQYRDQRQGQSFLTGSRRSEVLTEADNPEKMVDRWLKRRSDIPKGEFGHFLKDLRSIRTNDEKYIHASDGYHEFYDLKADPAESKNIYDSTDQRIISFDQKLKEWIGTCTPHVAKSDQPGFDKDTWEKLKMLGYA
jgi:arylsulfatase A-like enzyme